MEEKVRPDSRRQGKGSRLKQAGMPESIARREHPSARQTPEFE